MAVVELEIVKYDNNRWLIWRQECIWIFVPGLHGFPNCMFNAKDNCCSVQKRTHGSVRLLSALASPFHSPWSGFTHWNILQYRPRSLENLLVILVCYTSFSALYRSFCYHTHVGHNINLSTIQYDLLPRTSPT